MRLADTPAPSRAGGDAEAVPAGQGAAADGAGFAAAVAALEAARDEITEVRDDLEIEDWPAPKRLAPYATRSPPPPTATARRRAPRG